MRTLEWKDATSYSRGRERKPNTWTTEIAGLVITVCNGHVNYPGKWIMHCYDIRLDTIPLDKATTLDEAKQMAVGLVKRRVALWDEAMQEVV